jgi:DNA (cytosine-5)-methyltransferase 1
LGSRVSQYEQVGNAVPVLMARAIAERIRVHLEEQNADGSEEAAAAHG